MKPALKIASHLGAVVFGVVLAATVAPYFSSSRANSGPFRAHDRSSADFPNSKGKTDKSSSHTVGQSKSAAFRAAWAELAKEPLNPPELITAQKQLLIQWAEVDLDGALQAFLGEAWDRNISHSFVSDSGLAAAFATEFREHPESSWAALSRNKMALALLAQTWIRNVAGKNPELVISLIGEIPINQQSTAIRCVFGPPNSFTPEQLNALVTQVASTGTPEQIEHHLTDYYELAHASGDPAALAAQWNALPAGPQRTAQIAAWAYTMRGLDVAKFSAEWEKVPAADQAQAARLLLAQVDNKSPALLFAIDRAIETQQWNSFKDDIADKLRGFRTDRQALAEWALKLPERQETRFVFNLAISEKLLADPDAGRAWLEQLPVGDWHREWGFVELTLGRMWARNDIAGANQAISHITDPRAREEALKCRYDWQLLNAQPNIIREHD